MVRVARVARVAVWLVAFGLMVPVINTWAANPARFVARFADGTVVESDSLSDWHNAESTPKIAARSLFDPSKPVRWIIDRIQPPAPALPPAFVEMATGDRLPGAVVDYLPADTSGYQSGPAAFVVEYEGPTGGTLEKQRSRIRVDTRFVRRIRWTSEGNETRAWQPRTLFLRDGSFLSFRAIRWGTGLVSVLLDSGPRRLAIDELAEVHLPSTDFWPLYLEELAILSPDGATRLLQMDTNEGAVITTSLARTIPRVFGDTKDLTRWVLGVQPAWSLDVLWLWQGTVRTRRSFAPHEVPLTRMIPTRAEQRSAFGSHRSGFAVNRNLQDYPLRSASREAGWGFGVQAFSELEFELPSLTRSLRSDFAIDALMEEGGCVQPRIVNATAGNGVIFQGPIIVGSDTVVDTGAVAIAGSGESPRRVVLQVDPVLNNRPTGADPFDVRDHANWLDPFVELDSARLRETLLKQAPQLQPAWRDWTFAPAGGAKLSNVNFFAEAPGNSGEFALAAAISGGESALKREHTLEPGDRWLVVDAVRAGAGAAAKLKVTLPGGPPVEWEPPQYDKSRSDFRPLIVPLPVDGAAPGSKLAIAITATAAETPLLWRALQIAKQNPLYFEMLDEPRDKLELGVNLNPSTGGEFDPQQPHSGKHAFRFPAGGQLELSLLTPVAIRERPQLGEYRFLRFAIRQRGSGAARLELRHARSAEQPAGYTAGREQPEIPGYKRITDQPIAESWQVFTRDLYGDFGNIELQSLSFQGENGETFLDHVYLGRTQSDFDKIPAGK